MSKTKKGIWDGGYFYEDAPKKRKAKKKRECLVRGNKVFFYGKTAALVERAIKVSGLTPTQFLDQAIRNTIIIHELQDKLGDKYVRARNRRTKSR